jgi:hypothetical protein
MVLVSPIEIKVAASPEVPRYLPLPLWKRMLEKLGVKVKREIAVFFLKTQNCYIVAPESLPEFTARLDTLGFRSAEPVRIVK